eukprot:TRINITY_DN480_c0_g3_i1.p1 TRINITY_DN480_c0_g3~~TRINITY_DN480_c0_g3_i1.p1  ORF type:complete len:466 (-),score=118.74 TRINITY_DN480_c0_g3_i1:80-1477(-)
MARGASAASASPAAGVAPVDEAGAGEPAVQMTIRRTFIELVDTSAKDEIRTRALTDSAVPASAARERTPGGGAFEALSDTSTVDSCAEGEQQQQQQQPVQDLSQTPWASTAAASDPLQLLQQFQQQFQQQQLQPQLLQQQQAPAGSMECWNTFYMCPPGPEWAPMPAQLAQQQQWWFQPIFEDPQAPAAEYQARAAQALFPACAAMGEGCGAAGFAVAPVANHGGATAGAPASFGVVAPMPMTTPFAGASAVAPSASMAATAPSVSISTPSANAAPGKAASSASGDRKSRGGEAGRSRWGQQAELVAKAKAIEASAGGKTTVMLRNLPSGLTRSELLSILETRTFASAFDFVYLPIDFSSRRSLGYAFVNFLSPSDAARCWSVFDGFVDWERPAEKACEVMWGDPHQGLDAHIERYRNSPVMHDSVPDAWRPVLYRGGKRVAFPAPTKAVKAPKMRSRASPQHAA